MNTFEINKIVGAGLTALLSLFVIGYIGNALVSSDDGAHAPDAGHGAPAVEAAAPEKEEPVAPLAVLLAEGDMAAGEKVFKKCAACHTAEQGGANKVGPNLWGIVGHAPASVAGFAYSDAMSGKGGTWTLESLNEFLADPKGVVPGTKMSFAGIKKPDQRADLLLYLRSLSASPVPLPEPTVEASEAPKVEAASEKPAEEEAAASEEKPADEAKGEPEPAKAEETQTAAAGDAAAGEKVFRKCKACHTVDQGGANRVGPNLYGIVGRAKASAPDYSYSPAMAGLGGTWTEAELDTYLADPKGAVPGTKMSFPGLKKEADRVNVIAYLKSVGQ